MPRPSPFSGEDDPFGPSPRGDDGAPDEPVRDPVPLLLEGLTKSQIEAVQATEGPVLVLAAAGSGKTRVITRRIAFLLACGVPPWSILALTFTNKAAGEMRERVMRLCHEVLHLPESAVRGLTVTTFHSLCARLLRRYADQAGLKPDFTIYDASDQSSLVKKTIEALQLSTSNWPARSVLGAISAAKNQLLDAADFAARAGDFYSRTIAKIYTAYDKAMRTAGAVDFDDLLVVTAKLLRGNEAVREDCRRRWKYLLIDEYQDTNHAQFVIASMLAGGPAAETPQAAPPAAGASIPGSQPNIFVVGDPDQAIYGWRGADIANILEFEEHYPAARVITLGENFRSTEPILAVADSLIRNNRLRKHKDLYTTRPGGGKVEVTLCRDEHHEARLISDWFKLLHDPRFDPEDPRPGIPWREMAVLYRTNALSRVMEDTLRAAGIPYIIARGTAFYEREEIRNALAYLRVIANPADSISLGRIINVPTRGLGSTTISKLEEAAQARAVPLLEVVRSPQTVPSVNARAIAACTRFTQLLDGWTGNGQFLGSEVSGSLAELVERVIRESGLEAMYRAQAAAGKSEADLERLDNLAELVSSARDFELEYQPQSDPALDAPRSADDEPAVPPLLAMLRAYLESVSLVADADTVDPSQGAVTMLTLHAAKGLEFPAVAIIGLEEGMLPHARALQAEREMEEERRLCFVGITRAMQHLHMTTAKYRTIRGLPERTIPSRFVSEISQQHCTFSDQSAVDAGLEGTGWDGGDIVERHVVEEDESGNALRGGGKFPVGCTVRHPQFGVGRIRQVTTGMNARATIEFKAVGVKTLVLEYARLQRID
ncbi:MAG: UvrD-helicase domain-containing protein [Phycisphaerales bacterium]|nr:UvrD-helicase domain-containing protein [Phycisphaerales bacterium]